MNISENYFSMIVFNLNFFHPLSVRCIDCIQISHIKPRVHVYIHLQYIHIVLFIFYSYVSSMISTGMFNNFRTFTDIFSLEYVMQLQSFSMVVLAITISD